MNRYRIAQIETDGFQVVTDGRDSKVVAVLFADGSRLEISCEVQSPPDCEEVPLEEGIPDQDGWIPIEPGNRQLNEQCAAFRLYEKLRERLRKLPGWQDDTDVFGYVDDDLTDDY